MAYHGTPNVGLLSIGIKVYFIATIGLIQSVPVDLFCRHSWRPLWFLVFQELHERLIFIFFGCLYGLKKQCS